MGTTLILIMVDGPLSKAIPAPNSSSLNLRNTSIENEVLGVSRLFQVPQVSWNWVQSSGLTLKIGPSSMKTLEAEITD